jgi:formate-dependent nitrite reductase membrane component NrfD
VGWIGTPIALVLGAYHGFLMSFLYMRPLWSTGPYNIVHLLSTVTTGIAAVCLLALLRKQSREELKEIKPVVGGVLGFALLLQIAANIGWLSALAYGGAPAENAHRSLMAHFSLPYWLVAFSIGLAVPLVLLAASALKRKSAFADAALFLGSGMVIVGGFVFRYVTIIAGQIS